MQSGGALRRQYEEPQNKPSHNPNRKPKGRLFIINMDYTIYIVVAILTFVGIVMIFSASYLTTATSTRFGNNPFFYLQRTAQWAVLGFISMNVMTVVPYRLIKKFAYIIYVVTVILLVLVQIMGFAAGGAQRWLDNIPIVGQFQPSEVSKAAIIFMIARLISDNPEYLHKWKGLFVCGGFVGLITVLGGADFNGKYERGNYYGNNRLRYDFYCQ